MKAHFSAKISVYWPIANWEPVFLRWSWIPRTLSLSFRIFVTTRTLCCDNWLFFLPVLPHILQARWFATHKKPLSMSATSLAAVISIASCSRLFRFCWMFHLQQRNPFCIFVQPQLKIVAISIFLCYSVKFATLRLRVTCACLLPSTSKFTSF